MKNFSFNTIRNITFIFAATAIVVLAGNMTREAAAGGTRAGDGGLFDRLFGSDQIVNGFLAGAKAPVPLATPVTENAPQATETWSGGDANDAFWTSNDNWAGIGGAGAGDDLVFPQTAARKANTNDFGFNTSFNSLTFNGTDYVINGTAGNGISIILVNGMTVNVTAAGTMPRFIPNMFLGNAQTWTSNNGFVELDGAVNLQTFNLTLTGAGNHRFDGTMSSDGVGADLTKNGSGVAIMNGLIYMAFPFPFLIHSLSNCNSWVKPLMYNSSGTSGIAIRTADVLKRL